MPKTKKAKAKTAKAKKVDETATAQESAVEEKITRKDQVLALPVKLSEGDMSLKMSELLEALSRIEALEKELSEYSKAQREEIKEIEGQVKGLRGSLETGTLPQEVDCSIEYDWEKGVKTITRKDTGEIYDRKPIEDEERQQELSLETHGQPLDGKSHESGSVLTIREDDYPDTKVEVLDGQEWIGEEKISTLAEGEIFHIIGKDGKIVKIEGKEQFTAIDDSEKDESGWFVKAV